MNNYECIKEKLENEIQTAILTASPSFQHEDYDMSSLESLWYAAVGYFGDIYTEEDLPTRLLEDVNNVEMILVLPVLQRYKPIWNTLRCKDECYCNLE